MVLLMILAVVDGGSRQIVGLETGMIARLETDSGLIKRLQESAGKPITKKELAEQRVSFVYGNLPGKSTITRDRVEKRLKKNEGA